MVSDKLYIGIDLGGTKILTGLVNEVGQVIAEDYRKTRAKKGLDFVVGRLAESALQAMQNAGAPASSIQAVGIGVPGPVDTDEGIVTQPPNLPGWRNVPVRAMIEEALGIPTFLENDANAAALGEYLFGAGRGSTHMLYVTVSTGIGGGFILDGKLYHGADGAAGEIGHVTILPRGPHCGCGNRGCLESVASGTAIAREGRELVIRGVPTLISELVAQNPDAVTAKLVAEAAQRGDSEAQEIIREAMGYLGVGIASLVNLLNPEIVVIGGSLIKLGDILFDSVRRAVKRRAFPVASQRVRIVPAELGDRVGVCGAAAVAIQARRQPKAAGDSRDHHA
jgi:glucokinase